MNATSTKGFNITTTPKSIIYWTCLQLTRLTIISGKFVLQVEARDGLGTGPFADNAEIVIDIQSINNHRPVITNPALANSSVDIQGVRQTFSVIQYE